MLAFLHTAAVSYVRGRRRLAASVLGVLLAITFIAGTLAAMDTSTRSAVDNTLYQRPGDFLVLGNAWDTSLLADQLRAVDGVSNVSPTVRFEILQVGVWGSALLVDSEGLGIDPANPPTFVRLAAVEGSVGRDPGGVALSESLAAALNVSLGERVYLHTLRYNATTGANESCSVNATVEGILGPPPGVAALEGFSPYYSKIFVVRLQDVSTVRESLGFSSPPAWAIEVRIDRTRFVDPFNLDTTRANLLRIGRNLGAVASLSGATVQDNDSPLLTTLEGNLLVQRLMLWLLAVPVIILGLYLGALGIDLSHAERRRELAVLRARGLSGRQSMLQLSFEAVLGGIVAGVGGLLLGLVASRALLGSVAPSLMVPQDADVALSAGTVVVVALLSIAFMLVVTYRSARRTTDLPLVETLRYYAPGETASRYNPRYDAVLVAFGLTVFGMAYLNGSSSGGLLGFLSSPVSTTLFPVAPVFVMVGATRILTRISARTYDVVARLWKPVVRDLHVLISRNLTRNARRSANVALIISLGLAFAVFSMSVSTSQAVQLQQTVRVSVGGDARITVSSVDAAALDNITRIPGIAGASQIGQMEGIASFCCANAYVLDPATYFDIAQPQPWSLDGLDPADAASVLRNPGEVLISEAYARGASLLVGDALGFDANVRSGPTGSLTTVHVNMTIGGIVRVLPGFDPAATAPPSAFYTGFDSLNAVADRGHLAFVESAALLRLAPTADWLSVREALLRAGATNVMSYSDRLAAMSSAPFSVASRGFVDIEVIFVLLMITAGLGLIVYASSLEREVEFAGVIARGASRRQTSAILAGEGFAVMVVGVVMGLTAGLVSSWMTLQLANTQSATGVLVPLSFTFPVDGIVLLALAPAAMVLASVAVAVRISRMNVARVLKMRGG